MLNSTLFFVLGAIVILLAGGLSCLVLRRKNTPLPPNMPEIIGELRRKLRKDAIILRSTLATEPLAGYVSCLGRVTWQLPGEEWPLDAEGKRLEPLATIFVPDLPGKPASFGKVALITIFAPEDAWTEDPDEKPRLGCVIRVYPTLENLIPCDYVSARLKTCVLTPEAAANDIPASSESVEEELWDEVLNFEKTHKLDYRKYFCDAVYETLLKEKFPADFSADSSRYAIHETHKIGGHPTYTQGGFDIPEGYPFVMQIGYDFDAGLELGDCGSYYFHYNAEKNDWRVYFDCY